MPKMHKRINTLGKGPKIKKRESRVFDYQEEVSAKNKSLFRFAISF